MLPHSGNEAPQQPDNWDRRAQQEQEFLARLRESSLTLRPEMASWSIANRERLAGYLGRIGGLLAGVETRFDSLNYNRFDSRPTDEGRVHINVSHSVRTGGVRCDVQLHRPPDVNNFQIWEHYHITRFEYGIMRDRVEHQFLSMHMPEYQQFRRPIEERDLDVIDSWLDKYEAANPHIQD